MHSASPFCVSVPRERTVGLYARPWLFFCSPLLTPGFAHEHALDSLHFAKKFALYLSLSSLFLSLSLTPSLFSFSSPLQLSRDPRLHPQNGQAARLRIEGLLLQHSIEKQAGCVCFLSHFLSLLLLLLSPSSEEFEWMRCAGFRFTLSQALRHASTKSAKLRLRQYASGEGLVMHSLAGSRASLFDQTLLLCMTAFFRESASNEYDGARVSLLTSIHRYW